MSTSEAKNSTLSPKLWSSYALRKSTINKRETDIARLLPGKNLKVNTEDEELLRESFFSAIREGALESINLLIDVVDVNTLGHESATPLHVAAKYGNSKVVKLLIKKGASVNAALAGCRRGLTPLHLAVLSNQLKCAKILIENGASIFPQLEEIYHPIHCAVIQGHVKMTKLLLDKGANINSRFNLDFFNLLNLENITSDLSVLGHFLPLLHCSIIRKHKEVTELLLNRGADLNLNCYFQRTTLMQAVSVNDVELVRFLLKRGADPNARDTFGLPVLHFTMVNCNRKKSFYSKKEYEFYEEKLKIVELLVAFGADVNAQFLANKERTSVIHYMIAYGFHEGVSYLLYEGDLNYSEIDLATVFSGQLNPKFITPDIANDQNYLIELRRRFVLISFILTYWAIGRQMLGLPVKEEVILEFPIHRNIPREAYTEEINNFKNWISNGLHYLKETKVGDSTVTWWHLLTCDMNELVKLMSNKNVNCIQSFVRSRHKIVKNCFFVLQKRLEIAEKRRLLLAMSTELTSTLFVGYLPYDCCEKIVSYLNDKELQCVVNINNAKIYQRRYR